MKINSHNEWDTLREVIVGKAERRINLGFSSPTPLSDEALQQLETCARAVYPESMIDEVNEDLEGLCAVLKEFGAKVLRPNGDDLGKIFSTPNWCATGDDSYNMRDLHLVVGNTVIESPTQEKHRYYEAAGLSDIWYEYFEEGFRWIAAPKPKLIGEYMINFEENGNRHQKLAESEIIFEAANVVRMGKDLLYLVSRSGNRLGAKWLQSVVGDEYRVHPTEGVYRSSHIDSTFVCLRPGLVLLNGERVTTENCDRIFDKWEKIYFNDIATTPPETLAFHENVRKKAHGKLMNVNIQTDLDHLASDWIGMNVLSLDQNTVIVDQRQTALIKVFESHGLTPIPIRFRHSHLMRGALHCCTLDTVRDSELVSYID